MELAVKGKKKKRPRKRRGERREGKKSVAVNHTHQETEAVLRTKQKISRDMMMQQEEISQITKAMDALIVNDPISILKHTQLQKRLFRKNQSVKAKQILLDSTNIEQILKYRYRKSNTNAQRTQRRAKNPFHKRELRQSDATMKQIKSSLEKEADDLSLSCSDLSSDEDDTDEEFVLSDGEGSNDRKRKSLSVRRLRGALQKAVVGTVDHDFIDVEIYETESFPWIYELQALDTNVNFESRYLVAFPMEALPNCDILHLCEIVRGKRLQDLRMHCIKRCKNGQVYVAVGFRTIVHFTLGPTALDLLVKNGANLIKYKGFEQSFQHPIIRVSSVSGTNGVARVDTVGTILDKAMSLCEVAAISLSNVLFSKKRDGRCDYSIAYGFTDQKCDCYTSWNHFGSIIPDLIKLHHETSDNAKQLLAKVLVYFSSTVVPHLGLEQAFPHREVLNRFSSQLGTDHPIRIPSISLIAQSASSSKDLRPHCDKLNSRNIDQDVTVQLSFPVEVSKLPESVSAKFASDNTKVLNLGFIFYSRECVDRYCNKQQALNSWIAKVPSQSTGRKLLIEMFCDMDRSYSSLCFTQAGYKKIHHEMKGTDGSEIYFEGQCWMTPELIDKMSWWSSVLDSWLLFATAHGISKLETIETIVFFGHQCNTTPLFCQAMTTLALDFEKIRRNKLVSSKRCSMYTLLVRECQAKTGNKEKSSDTGSYGKAPRFSTSNAKVLDEDAIASSILALREIFDNASKLMNDVRSSQNSAKGIFDRLCITKSTIHRITCIDSLPSIGEVRAMHILQFAALTGLVPLEFYIYIPMHFSGGPMHWLQHGLGLKKSDFSEGEFLSFYSEFLFELQQLFNREVTSNIVEQASCYSARTVLRFDHWLSIPRYVNAQRKADGSKYTKGVFEDSHLQHFFRVFGNRTSNWELQMFDGNEKRCLFQSKSQKYKNLCSWKDEILYFEE